MPLSALNVLVDAGGPPREALVFLREAERRIERFQRSSPIHGFVPSDFRRTYAVLRTLAAGLPRGRLLCEWGSGFGVVACLAAMLEFDVCGIEIEPTLVDAAQRLADDFGLPVQFACGSFIPAGAAHLLSGDADFAWLCTDGNCGHQELELEPRDFDVVFSYPWPDEESLTEKLFERYGAVGAVLVSYHGGEDFRLRRKTGLRRRSRLLPS